MSVKIRLSRIGKKKVPFYRIIAVDSRKKRDGAYLENLGTYDGLKSVIVQFNEDRINYWIDKGAIPTDTVKKLIKQHKEGASLSKEAKTVAKKAKKEKKEVAVEEEPKAQEPKQELKKEEPKEKKELKPKEEIKEEVKKA